MLVLEIVTAWFVLSPLLALAVVAFLITGRGPGERPQEATRGEPAVVVRQPQVGVRYETREHESPTVRLPAA